MNYQKIYNSIVEHAKQRTPNGCVEKHHIIPVSIFEDEYTAKIFSKHNIMDVDSSENLVSLYAKEHFIVHLLLLRMFKGNKNCYERMLYAANMMASRTNTSRQYAALRERFAKMMSEKMTGKPSRQLGNKWTPEQKLKKSGENHPSYGKKYEEIYGQRNGQKLRQLRRTNRLGRKNSIETRTKLSERIVTDEWKQKISTSNRGKTRTPAQRSRISEYFSNPSNHPAVDHTKYKFYHKDGRVCVARKYDMKKNYGCNSIHKVIRGERNHCNGWTYKGEIIND